MGGLNLSTTVVVRTCIADPQGMGYGKQINGTSSWRIVPMMNGFHNLGILILLGIHERFFG